jgi:2-polyprenyl-6-methoxyphenol hydroxylase-like FAD-dependent oxidoreductase
VPEGRILALFMGASEDVSEARRDPDAYWARKLGEHPRMAARLAGAGNPSKLRSTADTTSFFRASSGPGWALLGDAGHFKDPVIGQGQRDALWSGRRLAEAVACKTQDHAATDIALRAWEHERDQECLPAYHFGNLETEVRPISPVLVEIQRRTTRDEQPDASDLFGRARTLPQVVTLARMQRGLADALRRRGHGSPRRVVPDALADLRTHLGVRTEARGGRFRSTRVVAGSEHPDATPPPAPVPPAVVAPASDPVGAADRTEVAA